MEIFSGITAIITVYYISERFEIKLLTSSTFPTVSAQDCTKVLRRLLCVRFRQSVSIVKLPTSSVFVNQSIILVFQSNLSVSLRGFANQRCQISVDL